MQTSNTVSNPLKSKEDIRQSSILVLNSFYRQLLSIPLLAKTPSCLKHPRRRSPLSLDLEYHTSLSRYLSILNSDSANKLLVYLPTDEYVYWQLTKSEPEEAQAASSGPSARPKRAMAKLTPQS